MAKNKFGIQFEGFTELMEQYDKLNGDLKGLTEKCLTEAHDMVTPKLHAAMNRHHRTGRTESSIFDRSEIEWDGNTASIYIGFDLKNDGLQSIFLMYGTPRVKKDTKLYGAIYGSAIQKQIAERQSEIIKDAIAKKLGGE